MITSVIIENEKKHSQHLTEMLSKHFPEIEQIALCETIPFGVETVRKLKPDLLFLDVELPPYTGFDLLEQTPNLNYKVIFTTSHNKYAVRAFEFCALDYIVKPFGVDSLKRSIDRYKENINKGPQNQQLETLINNMKQTEIACLEIYLPVKNGEIKINLGDITFCMAGDGGTTFHLKNGEHLFISKSLNWIEDILSDFHFFRTHDSYLVNTAHIKRITHVRDGAEILLSDGFQAEVSKRRKSAFLEAINKINILKKP